jgi:hypothetical protein
VAMSTGRMVLKELYVGFLLLLLTFLYLSHLNQKVASTEFLKEETLKAKRIEFLVNTVRG